MNPLFRPWRHLFDFRGRASRLEYVLFHVSVVLAYLLVSTLSLVGVALGFALTGDARDDGTVIGVAWVMEAGLFLLIFLIGHLSVSIRRLHDHGEPALKYLPTLIPLVGLAFWAMLVFTRGSKGKNEYGHDPRAPEPISTTALGEVFS